MNKLRFEKFEMKYGYILPLEYKYIINKFGGDTQLGSCRFEYPDKIINNLLRCSGKMDVGVVPFGDIGNGDYYCIYRYGSKYDEYFVGLWLHETKNFVVLASNFKSFLYKCILDDYLSNLVPDNDDEIDDDNYYLKENRKRNIIVCEDMKFDIDKINSMKNQFDYHRLMVEYDNKAIQSLCYLGNELIKRKDKNAFNFLKLAEEAFPIYTAPYYIKGRAYIMNNKSPNNIFLKGLKTSLSFSGYSYWEEDYIDIPEFAHREMSLYISDSLETSEDFFEQSIFLGEDVYNYEFRYELARHYMHNNNYIRALNEYNNALFCSDDKVATKDILKEVYTFTKTFGLSYIQNLVEHDIRMIR